MSQKQSVKKLYIIAATCIIVGIAIGLISSQLLASQEYKDMAQLLGSAHRIYPQTEDMLIQALKEANSSDFEIGDEILLKYGYSSKILWNWNAFRITGISVLLMLFLGILLGLAEHLSFQKIRTRIDGLTAYLKAVNLGKDTILIRQEDVFSHLEDELYKTVTELRQSRENALMERQSLADNLADISHQLKTPITSMSLMTQLLADSRTGEDAVYVEKLDRQIHRLEALVSALLTLSKLDVSTFEFRHEPIEVCAMLTLAAEPVKDMLQQRNQQLSISSESNISFSGDINWTAEAFLNLIKNCSEHTPENGTISIFYTQNPIYTEIIVEDSGSGFDINDLPHLFERFYKGKSAAKDSIGIGLALSKSIIQKQNGTIRAENAPKGGARFIVKFYT